VEASLPSADREAAEEWYSRRQRGGCESWACERRCGGSCASGAVLAGMASWCARCCGGWVCEAQGLREWWAAELWLKVCWDSAGCWCAPALQLPLRRSPAPLRLKALRFSTPRAAISECPSPW